MFELTEPWLAFTRSWFYKYMFCIPLFVFIEASVLFGQSHAHETRQAPDSVLNIAMTMLHQGQVPGAIRLYDSIARQADADRDSITFARVVDAQASQYLTRNKVDSALFVYQWARDRASIWGYQNLMLDMDMYCAMTKKRLGKTDEAFQDFRRLIPAFATRPDQQSLALQEYGALSYHFYQDRDSAMYFIDSALHLVQQLNDSVRLSSVLESAASINHSTGSFLNAIDYSLRAMSYVTGKNALKKFQLLMYISNIFKEMGQRGRAIEYAEEALRYAIEKNYKRSKAAAEIGLGELYIVSADYEKADSFLISAETYFVNLPATLEFLQVKTALAEIRLSQGYPEAALLFLQDIPKLPSRPHLTTARYFLITGLIHHRLNNLSQAKTSLATSLEIAEQLRDPRSILPALAAIRNLEEEMGNYRAALNANDRYLALYDSTFQLRQSQLIFESESRYQRAEQERAITELNAQNEIKDLHLAMREKQIRIGILGLLLFAALAGYIYFLYRQIKISKLNVEETNTKISKALKEKEFLLKEIHHRVKNNLQVVSSLLSLQSRYIEDRHALEAINEGRDRVKSMALIHQNLYQGENLTGIPVKPYFEKLISGLFNSYNISPQRIKLQLDIDALMLDVDSIVPIGLIVNELVSNALKYAFPEDRAGTIKVSLKEWDHDLLLTVSDDGIGMLQEWQEEQATSFGYRLIHAFREKLNADLNVEGRQGTTVTMRIREFQKIA